METSNSRPVLLRASLDTLVVTGPDRLSWLEGLVTCDVADLTPGTGRWGLVLDKSGKIVSEIHVVPASDCAFVSVPFGAGTAVAERLERHLIMEDAELVVAPDREWRLVYGPGSVAVARAVAEAAGGTWAAVPWGATEGGAVVAPAGRFDSIDTLRDCGAPTLDADAWEAVRLALALPRFGVDYGPDDRPHEASMERRAISWTKGCYLGQEVVCMQDMRGKVQRHLVAGRMPVESPPGRGADVVDPGTGETVGEVTSSARGPEGSAWVMMRVRRRHGAAREALSIGGHRVEIVDRTHADQ